MEKRLCSVYCFTNLINGKQYIGSTIKPVNRRYNEHIYNATHENARQYNYPLYQAIRKYGIENFKFEVLESKECSETEIRLIEADYIVRYNCVSPNGYNQTYDTEHPINSPETYAKIRETKREKSKQVAEINTDNELISTYRSIVDCAEATGLNEKKIAAVCRGERLTTGERRFCWIDDSGKLEIPVYTGNLNLYKGKSGITQIQSSSRKIAKMDLKTNEILDTYDTIALAARENNCDASGISKVCRGKRNSAGGFKWKYLDEE